MNPNAAVLNDKLLQCHFVFKHHGLLLPNGQMYHTAIDLESLFKYQHRFRFETVERKKERERGQEQQTGSSRETKERGLCTTRSKFFPFSRTRATDANPPQIEGLL